MLLSLLNTIEEAFTYAKILIHSYNPELYDKSITQETDVALYSWAVFQDRRVVARVIRMLVLMLACLKGLIFKKFSSHNKKLDKLIKDYITADLIVFVGGGYLRSQSGLTQALNFLMQLVMFRFALFSKAPKIVAPISFGPFAYSWQEKMAAKTLGKVNRVTVREDISYERLKMYGLKNVTLLTDLALFLQGVANDGTISGTVGFTIRSWLPSDQQKVLESSYVEALAKIAVEKQLQVRPIVQVDAVEYGDDDAVITKKLAGELVNRGVKVLPTITVKDVEHGIATYANIDFLLGMRMHSDILAAVSDTPFVAISYEHKAEGISKRLEVEECVIKCEVANSDNIYSALKSVYDNLDEYKRVIKGNVASVAVKERQQWVEMLKSIQVKERQSL